MNNLLCILNLHKWWCASKRVSPSHKEVTEVYYCFRCYTRKEVKNALFKNRKFIGK